MRTDFRLMPVAAGLIAACLAMPSVSFAVGGPSGTAVTYATQGQLGQTVVNPYGLAPLTAVIRNGGYVLKKATVRIVPKRVVKKFAMKWDLKPYVRMAVSLCLAYMPTIKIRLK